MNPTSTPPTEGLAETADSAVLEAMTIEVPRLVQEMRELVKRGCTNRQIISRACDKGASANLMRNMTHCLDAVRREPTPTP